jgi:SAM-dependent methyltransferase
MALASTWCQGQGAELGAAAHNRFDLPGSINIAPYAPIGPDYEDFVFYSAEQETLCGAYALIDIAAEADHTTLGDSSQDYVISSHVIEHVPNLIAAFEEWNRIVRDGGIVFMIFPMRDSHPPDRVRPITPLGHVVSDYERGETVATHEPPPEGRRGHYHVFTLDAMKEVVVWCGDHLPDFSWECVAEEETDSKVGNGHTLVYRIAKTQPSPLIEEAGAAKDHVEVLVGAPLDDEQVEAKPRRGRPRKVPA